MDIPSVSHVHAFNALFQGKNRSSTFLSGFAKVNQRYVRVKHKRKDSRGTEEGRRVNLEVGMKATTRHLLLPTTSPSSMRCVHLRVHRDWSLLQSVVIMYCYVPPPTRRISVKINEPRNEASERKRPDFFLSP